MQSINRSAVIIKPKQPFLDWLNSVPGEEPLTMKEITRENTTLLIPQFDTLDEAQEYLKKMYKQLFDFELFGWYRDRDYWPRNKTYKMFLEWFDITINSEAFDLVDDEIVKEELYG